MLVAVALGCLAALILLLGWPLIRRAITFEDVE